MDRNKRFVDKIAVITGGASGLGKCSAMTLAMDGAVSCIFDQYSSDEIGQVLSEQHIAFRSGLHCAPLAHKFINTFPAGTVRFSVGYFNTDEDFAQLDQALRYIYENS